MEYIKLHRNGLCFLEGILILPNCELYMLLLPFSLPAKFIQSFPSSADIPEKANCPPLLLSALVFLLWQAVSAPELSSLAFESESFKRNFREKPLLWNPWLNAICLFQENYDHFSSKYVLADF